MKLHQLIKDIYLGEKIVLLSSSGSVTFTNSRNIRAASQEGLLIEIDVEISDEDFLDGITGNKKFTYDAETNTLEQV